MSPSVEKKAKTIRAMMYGRVNYKEWSIISCLEVLEIRHRELTLRRSWIRDENSEMTWDPKLELELCMAGLEEIG